MSTAVFLFVAITAVRPLLLFVTKNNSIGLQHLILDVSRAYDAFIFAQDEAQREGTAGNSPNPATAFFADISTPKYLALAALYQATTAVGDAFMVGSSLLPKPVLSD